MKMKFSPSFWVNIPVTSLYATWILYSRKNMGKNKGKCDQGKSILYKFTTPNWLQFPPRHRILIVQ